MRIYRRLLFAILFNLEAFKTYKNALNLRLTLKFKFRMFTSKLTLRTLNIKHQHLQASSSSSTIPFELSCHNLLSFQHFRFSFQCKILINRQKGSMSEQIVAKQRVRFVNFHIQLVFQINNVAHFFSYVVTISSLHISIYF